MVARLTEWAIPKSSAWITSRREFAGYPSRSATVPLLGVGAPWANVKQLAKIAAGKAAHFRNLTLDLVSSSKDDHIRK